MLILALLWYKRFRQDLKKIGFEFNPYDPCVANRIVESNVREGHSLAIASFHIYYGGFHIYFSDCLYVIYDILIHVPNIIDLPPPTKMPSELLVGFRYSVTAVSGFQ